MLSRLRKPPVPETPDFWDRLEADLRRRIAAKPEGSRRRTRWMARLSRPIARPLVHGAMAVIALAMVGTLGLPPFNPPADVSETAPSNPIRISSWVPVIEVEDPQAPVVLYAMSDRVSRFISFIESPTGDQMPVVEDLSAL